MLDELTGRPRGRCATDLMGIGARERSSSRRPRARGHSAVGMGASRNARSSKAASRRGARGVTCVVPGVPRAGNVGVRRGRRLRRAEQSEHLHSVLPADDLGIRDHDQGGRLDRLNGLGRLRAAPARSSVRQEPPPTQLRPPCGPARTPPPVPAVTVTRGASSSASRRLGGDHHAGPHRRARARCQDDHVGREARAS